MTEEQTPEVVIEEPAAPVAPVAPVEPVEPAFVPAHRPAPAPASPPPFGDVYAAAAQAFRDSREGVMAAKADHANWMSTVETRQAALDIAKANVVSSVAAMGTTEIEARASAKALRAVLNDYIGE